MSMPSPGNDNRPRASRTVKLVLMGVAGAALLYSCTPGVGGLGGVLPWLWLMGNPFSRGPATVSAPSTTTPTPGLATPAQTQSQRGGFGGSATQHGTTGTS
jgi:hypothetical protein